MELSDNVRLTFPHRRLTPAEATSLGYKPVHVRQDDGTVQSMEAPPVGYLVTYGAPSYTKAVERADAILAERERSA